MAACHLTFTKGVIFLFLCYRERNSPEAFVAVQMIQFVPAVCPGITSLFSLTGACLLSINQKQPRNRGHDIKGGRGRWMEGENGVGARDRQSVAHCCLHIHLKHAGNTQTSDERRLGVVLFFFSFLLHTQH